MINAPQMSERAAAAPAAALGSVASAIASVGTHFEAAAHQVQKLEDGRMVSEGRNRLALAYSDHQVALQNDPDPASRITRTRDFFTKYKGTLEQPDMSDGVKSSLLEHFDDFATQGMIHQAADSASLSVKRAGMAVQNELEMHFQNNDRPGANDTLARWEATGVPLPEELDKARLSVNEKFTELENKQAYETELELIRANPRDWLANHPEGSTIAGMTPQQQMALHSAARSANAQEQSDILDTIRTGIVTGEILDDAGIDKLDEGNGKRADPLTLAAGKHQLAILKDATQKKRVDSADYQEALMGEVSARLNALDPENLKDRLALTFALGNMTPGEVKNHYSAEFKRRIDGTAADDTELKNALAMADESFQKSFAFRGKQSQTVEASINDGFLRDATPKGPLMAVGLTQEQATQVAGAQSAKKNPTEADNDAAKAREFATLWHPSKAPKGVDGLQLRIAQAIRDGKSGVVSYTPPAEEWESKKNIGRAQAAAIRLSKKNPNASADELLKVMVDAIAPNLRAQYIKSAFSDPDPNNPLDGMVLPPRTAQPANLPHP